jgi:hypothetical protein
MFFVTLAGVLAVIAYTTVAAWQACLMRGQLTATQGQLTVLQDQLDAMANEQRAWVQPVLDGFTGATLTAETFQIGLKINPINTGKLPAFYVVGSQELVSEGDDADRLGEHDRLCKRAEQTAKAAQNPLVLFPSNPNIRSVQGEVIPDPEPAKISALTVPGKPFLAPEILGCIVYKSPAYPKFHHTWYSWPIWKYDQGHKPTRIMPGPQTIPGDQLLLWGLGTGRNYAD